ncbi:MAG: long-chain fatty acid--CoA ligase [Promethearchaeia archaeon]
MGNKWNKYLRLKRYENLPKMVFDVIQRHSEKLAMRWFEDGGDSIQKLTYAQLGKKIIDVFYGLKQLNYEKGDHIAICSETSQMWAFADLGVQCLGGVTVAIYPSLTPKEILYILKDSETKCLFVDSQENLEKVVSIWKEIINLKDVILMEDIDTATKKEVISDYSSNEIIPLDGSSKLDHIYSWEEFLRPALVKSIERKTELVEQSMDAIKEEDLASLIYTSGTTGIPKGVMLTHKNFLSDIVASSAIASTLEKDEKPWAQDTITYLPYAHSFGRTVEEYSMIYNGSCINYVGGRSQELLQKAFEEFQPTIMIGVPYVFQKLYETIMQTVDEMSEYVQNIFHKAVKAGKEYYTNKIEGKKNSFGLRIKYWILKKLVLGQIQKKLGGRLKIMLSGSAAISPSLMLFFLSCGFNMLEGYGLTESAPVTHVLRNEENSDFRPNFSKKIPLYEKLGSIGPPVEIPNNPYENVQQKLTEEGELLIKGPMVMKGYWKKPKLTANVVDEDGWLHTGDLAEIDNDGYVKIKGRLKAIVKLSTGKMVSPAAVEGMIVPYSEIVAQIILVGSEKKYLTAIVVPYQEPLKNYAEEHDISYDTWEDIIRTPEILQLIKKDIEEYTEDVSHYSVPKKFAISSQPFGKGDGYLTPTLKFKRNKIYEDFQDVIDKLYEIDGEFYIIEERMTDFYDQSLLT